MPHKGRSRFSAKTYTIANFLRNGLRILFLLIFLHWVLWLTSYANCINYQEAIISEKSVKEEEKIKEPSGETKEYQRFTGWFNKQKKTDIKEIEEDVLSQIEEKKGLTRKEELRVWKNKKLPELEKLHQDKEKQAEELKKKANPSKKEKEELEKKEEKYKDELEKAKEGTIKNIKDQLENNKLSITELDDRKNWSKRILHDPLKFFIVSPLNKTSKILGLQEGNHVWKTSLEIIFKLLIIEIVLVLIYYSETIVMWENMEKARNPYLSVEEREQLNLEASSLFKYALFNGCMMMLFNFFLFFHPAFFDRTNPLFQPGTSGISWWIWVFLIFLSLLLSSISTESLHHGRLLTFQELKFCVAKSWVVNLIVALIMIGAMRIFRMNSIGNHLVFFLGGLVRFGINTFRVKFFGHREYLPQRGTGAPQRRPYV